MFLALLLFFIVLFVLTIFDYLKVQKPFKFILFGLSCFYLIFLITFRYNVPDYDSYVEIFNDVKFSFDIYINNDIHGEFGYLFLNSLIRALGGNEITLFAIVGTLSIIFTAAFYKKYTNYFLVALLLYFSHIFLLREMIQIRSGLAISITMFAIPHIENRDFIKFLRIMLIASSIHSICLLFILLYVLFPYFQTTKIQIGVLILGVIFGITFNLKIIEKILGVFNAPSIVFDYLLDEKYNFNLGLFNPVLFKNLIVIAVLIFNKFYFSKNIKHFNVLLLSYIIGTFWLSTFNSFAIFSARIATLFSNVEHVLIPSLLLLQKQKLLIYLMILFYCIYSFVMKWPMISTWLFSI